MSNPSQSIYDDYKLSNSSAIPLYEGSAGVESIKVGQLMQGYYDEASQGADIISNASDNVPSMARDKGLAMELQNEVHGKVDQWSKEKNWEDKVPDVRTLGHHYSARAQELAAPIQQYQTWKEKELNDKDKDLTSDQKDALERIALSNYGGLKKDAMGRYIGTFDGGRVAKNIDIPKWTDDKIRGYVEQEGGTDLTVDNGVTKYRRAGTWHVLSAPRIQAILSNARNLDGVYRDYADQEGRIAAFPVKSNIQHIDQITNPLLKSNVAALMKKGYSLQDAADKATNYHTQKAIEQTMDSYAINKYAHNNRTSITEDGPGKFAKPAGEDASQGLFGDAVTDVGVDLSKKYGSADDVETSYKNTGDVLTKTTNEFKALRQNIARTMGTTESALTDDQINDYYTKNDPTGLGEYKSKSRLIESSKESLAELNQLRERSMDLAVKKKFPGQTYDVMKQTATQDFQKAVKDDKISFMLNGKIKVDASNISDYEVVDGDRGFANPVNYITLKDKSSGKLYKVQTKGNTVGNNDSFDSGDMSGAVQNDKLNKIGGRFDGLDWKSTWTEAATNIRSNTMWMPLQNKTTTDGNVTKAGAYAMRVQGALRAGSGGLSLKDADLGSMGSDNVKDMRGRIGAGKFDVLGIGKAGADGKLYAKLSVEVDSKADDPADRFKTVVVAMDSNLANKMSKYAIEAGVRDKDLRSYQVGKAIAPGSGYEKVLNMGTTGGIQINDKNNTPKYEVVPNITGSSSDALSYELYDLDTSGKRTGKSKIPGTSTDLTFDDAFDLGAFLDSHKEEGNIIKTKTK